MEAILNELHLNAHSLRAAVACLEPSQASKTCQHLIKTVCHNIDTIIGLPAQPDPHSTVASLAQSTMEGLPDQVLFGMDVWEVAESTQGYELTNGHQRKKVDSLNTHCFEITPLSLQVTMHCKIQAVQLLEEAKGFELTSIHERLTLIWFTIMSSIYQEGTRKQALTAFNQQVEVLRTKMAIYRNNLAEIL